MAQGEELGQRAAGSVGKEAGCPAMMDYKQQSNVDSNSMTNPPLSKNTGG